MPRTVHTALAIAALALLAPAAADAATYTVDSSAAAGCNGTTCKTIKDAVGKAGDGDTINVNAISGVDNEAGPIVVKQQNLTISATLGTVAVSSSDTTAGDAVFQLGDNSGSDGKGTTLKGLVVIPPANGGAAVDVQAQGTTVTSSYLARQLAVSSAAGDTPAYRADAYTGAGVNTLSSSFVIQTPSGTALKAPAVLGSASSGLVLTDDAVASSAGPGVSLTGASATAAEASQLQRDTLVATTGDALAVTQAANAANALNVSIDSTILNGGSSGADLDVSNVAGPTPTDTAAATKVTVVHGSLAGGKSSVVAAENSVGTALAPPGGVEVDLDRSIIHGPATATHAAGNAPVTSGSTSLIAIQNSDTDVAASSTASQMITLTGTFTNTDGADFADVANHNLHLRLGAPVIDKAGAVQSGESAKDVDGDPRVVGAQSDYGADEFVEHAPTAVLKASAAQVAPGAAVTFDGSGSTDPDPGDKVVAYHWAFGDGTTADTTVPTVSHAYAAAGSYGATLTVTDSVGTASAASAATAITVAAASTGGGGAGNPPSIKISKPTANQVLALRGKATKKSKKGKLKTITFTGTASGGSGVKYVILVLQRVSLAKTKATAKKSAKTCVYFNGKSAFASVTCTKPTIFTAKLGKGTWSYPITKKVALKAGTYTLIAAAVGTDGSTSAAQTTTFKLK